MASPSPLDMLRERAEETLDATTQQLGKVRQNYEQARAQLDQLKDYQLDYQQQLVNRAADTGIPVTHLLNYQGFIHSLEKVTQHYSEHVTSCAQAVDRAVCDWKMDHRRLNAFNTLKTRADDAAKLKESRQDQKMMDEFASQLFARKQSA
ncbi:flagella biosynthesis chaperone FliJ [Candidatus Pantoea deserta]|uniref:Flagellar FliJ protein n=1 Tax=Candidatus Pantoea deserta TaxID=1869313 RepID=A0A3N4P7G6_9GAMM|nr:flagellar export protein FliJ [Pantoea deserta]RPE04613.1 flagella biosynthesis chaperone FliJ [Pantoea deserta]